MFAAFSSTFAVSWFCWRWFLFFSQSFHPLGNHVFSLFWYV
jgi:hypothetical protein